jgi:hypothetical protein
VTLGDDKSIVFPQFFGQAPVVVGAAEKPYELDGSFLRAVTLAANDFRPPTAEKQPCWASQQALRYRVVRRGNIIFVRVDEEPELCGMQYISLDTGANYAISTSGQILRRTLDGEPYEPSRDAGIPAGQPVEPPALASTPDAGL